MYLILFLVAILSISALIYLLFKSLNINLLITIICSVLIIQIVLSPKLCMDSALFGLNLYITKVFPSLFPFLVITSLMMYYDGIDIYSKVFGVFLCKPLRLPLQCTFAIVVSLFCGYPLGAKYTCDLYERGHIDFKTCERLLNIASNASPLFIIGSVGTAMLNNIALGYLLLVANFLSCFFMGIILPRNASYKELKGNEQVIKKNKNIGSIIRISIEDSIKTSLNIGGFVILFSVIITIVKSNILFDIAVKNLCLLFSTPKSIVEGILLGIIEMTNGAYLISSSSVTMYTKVLLISFILGFSGFSVILQVFSFTYKHNLSMKKYILRKILQGFICSIIAIILYKITYINAAVNTFADENKSIYISDFKFLFSALLILSLPFMLNKFKKLLHIS